MSIIRKEVQSYPDQASESTNLCCTLHVSGRCNALSASSASGTNTAVLSVFRQFSLLSFPCPQIVRGVMKLLWVLGAQAFGKNGD